MANIDWKNGTYKVPEMEAHKSTFRVTVGSDWGALWDYEDFIQKNPLAVYGDLLPLFQNSDLNLVNVESAFGVKGAPVKKAGPNLRSPLDAEKSLSAVPFHVGCLANNHIMDFGAESLEETIGILHDAGIKTVGAGMNGADAAKPVIIPMQDGTLGIINCAEGEACASINGGPGANPFDVPAVIDQIHELKQKVDAVLLIFHGGREYAPCPPPYVVSALRRFAEAGADAIVAHHPHVPQGIEIHQGVPIAYSEGNFVFRWADTRDDDRYFICTGYLVHIDFVGSKLKEFSLTPYRMKSDGVFALQGEQKAQLFSELEHVSQFLSDEQSVQQLWEAFVDGIGKDRMLHTLRTFIDLFEEDEELGAARLHNLFFCPAHRNLYLNGLKRISHGKLGDSPEWAQKLVKDWGTRKL